MSTPLQQPIALHKLPIELVQIIASYLSTPSAASFSLTSRYILHAIGHQHLQNYFLAPGLEKHIYRQQVSILESAFPSHWYCAWCETFHAFVAGGGPRTFGQEKERGCVGPNGYLEDGEHYRLCFHHVRMAVQRGFGGAGEEIGVQDLAYVREERVKLGRSVAVVRVVVDAKIVAGRMVLCATCSISLERAEAMKWGRVKKIMRLLPQIVAGHRSDKRGHSNLRLCVETALREGRKFPIRRCACCPTEYRVGVEMISISHPGHVVLEIKTWRDLGDGRNPFESAWRAHCVFERRKNGTRHVSNLAKGGIHKLYESGDANVRMPKEYKPSPSRIARSFEYPVKQNWPDEIRRLKVARVREMSDPATRSHQLRVVENNEKVKARGKLFTPPYGLTWDQYVDLGGMRGMDGIPLIESERVYMISGHGLWGGLMQDLKNMDVRRDRWKIKKT